MTLALLLLIMMLFFPVGMLFLGKGEAKSTGFACAVVGTLVVISAILQVAVPAFADPLTGGLLFVFGVLYLQTAHALWTGLEDMRTVGNGAFIVAVVCAMYAYLYFTGGGLKTGGSTSVAVVPYLGFMMVTFVVICLTVTGVTYGKVSAKLAGWMFVSLCFVSLFVPAIGLMGFGKLPF